MNIEDVYKDIEEWSELGDKEYAEALAELVEAYENDYDTAYDVQTRLNEKYPEYPKINLL